ncbi:arginyltransferase [Marinospirillum insulare]|uniref:Aspartate/glutamate leucyltransferase n=1 Tax=Marinospirillum insulare TaxID=217169 RepID=A0ABQ5ZVQ7_9GAMM|nr:arginyltransferase [Marinospirillum insulare]GLR63118.1 putative arginyl-tRNA--protein transferase [Marinospirillum insulare]
MNKPNPQSFTLRFYQTLPHACSYLEDEEATTLFLDPQQPVTAEVYDALTQVGFRRSGKHLYRPHCDTCNACKSVRVKVAEFTPSRQQQRTLKRNQDLSWKILPTTFSSEHYQLYEKYINHRHADGDMYPASEEQFRSFLLVGNAWANLVEFRDSSGRLVAVAAVDNLRDGLSAIYTFFDPTENRRSLGVFAVLWQLEQVKKLGLPYLYLGYWIKNCRKMNYKQAYQPLEILEEQQWQAFPES